jgi:hypothetical protein
MNYVELAQAHIAELYPIIVHHDIPISELPPGAILGTWAYSVPGKIRYILSKELEMATGVLPADVARAWIRDEYELPFRRRVNQLARGYTVPLHARRGEWGDCSYIDIKGAYLKILSLGYDLEYLPGKYLGAEPREVPVDVATNKFCYSIAVAMSGTRISNLDVMGKDGVFKHRPINLYSNPCLFNLAQDTLNAVGAEMLAVLGDNVVYANTDGYLVKAGFEQYAIDIIASWGFKSSVKHQGETHVYGSASWKCGDHVTKRRDPNALDFTSHMMEREQRGWLKGVWARWNKKLNL